MGTNVGRASARPLRRQRRPHFTHNLRRIDAHRLGDANQLDDVEPPRAALDLRQIRRRKAELGRDVRLLELLPLARADEHLAEDAQLAGQFGLGGDAVGAAVARGHGVTIVVRAKPATRLTARAPRPWRRNSSAAEAASMVWR